MTADPVISTVTWDIPTTFPSTNTTIQDGTYYYPTEDIATPDMKYDRSTVTESVIFIVPVMIFGVLIAIVIVISLLIWKRHSKLQNTSEEQVIESTDLTLHRDITTIVNSESEPVYECINEQIYNNLNFETIIKEDENESSEFDSYSKVAWKPEYQHTLDDSDKEDSSSSIMQSYAENDKYPVSEAINYGTTTIESEVCDIRDHELYSCPIELDTYKYHQEV